MCKKWRKSTFKEYHDNVKANQFLSTLMQRKYGFCRCFLKDRMQKRKKNISPISSYRHCFIYISPEISSCVFYRYLYILFSRKKCQHRKNNPFTYDKQLRKRSTTFLSMIIWNEYQFFTNQISLDSFSHWKSGDHIDKKYKLVLLKKSITLLKIHLSEKKIDFCGLKDTNA